MHLISDKKTLAKICKTLAKEPFITLDTEFHRETYYYPKLCMIQVAGENDAYLIDPLDENMDLAPFYELLANKKVVKVMHSGRQDIEIFYNHTGKVPAPVFDTQIAAMVCGFGDSVSYSQLVNHYCNVTLDKSARITDWENRPLSEKQEQYALADVTYLRDIYKALDADIKKEGRESWIKEEMEALTNQKQFENDPEVTWLKIKVRDRKSKLLQRIKAISMWREKMAQEKNIPKTWIVKDQALVEIANSVPKSVKQLRRNRMLARAPIKNAYASAMVELLESLGADPVIDEDVKQQAALPKYNKHIKNGGTKEMLKLLLKVQSEKEQVAAKLIIEGEDLAKLAEDDTLDLPVFHGWRNEIFGKYAKALIQGELMLGVKENEVVLIMDEVNHEN